jgi:hypothetical protein
MIAGLLLGFTVLPYVGSPEYAVFSPSAIAKISKSEGLKPALKIFSNADSALANTPSPMPRVHTEGTLPHKGIRDESIAAERDWGHMLDFALAYRLSGDRKYLDAETRFLGAWMAVYKTSLNPIDETPLDQVVIAFDLTRGDLPEDLQARTISLLRTMAEGYLGFVESHQDHRNAENWQSHRIKLATLAAYAVDDPMLIRRARRVFQVQIGANIRPDGSVEDFYKRDALHYVTYDLEPLEMAALAAQTHGQDWFHFKSPEGSSLVSAVDWLLPYATGKKTHEEFVHSTVGFDAARNQAGEKGYSGQWDPQNSLRTLALAAALDPDYLKPLQTLESEGRGQIPFWIWLLDNASR